MKSRRIVSILGIALIVTLLFIIFPTSPILAADTTTLTPSSGSIGTTIALHGEFDLVYNERFAIVYMSPTSLAIGANITSAPSWEKVVDGVHIPMPGHPNAGIFDCSFNIPAVLADGSTLGNVTPGQYYIYTETINQSGVYSHILTKTDLLVTAPAVPTLNPLAPATGLGGAAVVVSGVNFPINTPLLFKFDTTTLTPTAGDTTTRSTGAFSSTITVPMSAATGIHPITVTAGTVTLSANFTVGSNAVISLSAAAGLAGASITVNGTGFPASSPLTLKFDITVLTPTSGSTATGTTGGFTSVITIPTTATTGAHTIFAYVGTATANQTFTVTGGGIIPMNISPNNGPIGTVISMAGGGLAPNHTFTVLWNGASTNVTGTTQTDGSFLATFTVPATIHGAHLIAVNDGTTTASANFTIESTPPTTPQPLRPYMDEAVSSPITLDWDDVTDPSMPVTYSVQISASANFTTNLINLTGLATSQYILTDADLLNFTTGQTYYWRESAVDAAQNQSAWTGANAFSITQGFQFTGWIMWVTIGVAVVLLFLLGIWIGRKTAYSY